MQAQYGLSLEAQQAQIEGYARAYGYQMVGLYVDQDSAKNTTGRPQYQEMMGEVNAGRVEFIKGITDFTFTSCENICAKRRDTYRDG